MKRIMFMMVTSSLLSLSVKAQDDLEAGSFKVYQEVVKALQPYIEGARTGDGKLSRSAFFDHAHIVGSVDGQFSSSTADEFGKDVTDLGAASSIQYQIALIDISGPAAAAKVEFFDWKGFRFTDYFVLYKHKGKWKISGKTYDSHSNN
ncbi:MAG: nuclear transport factor 2 family protein [Cyclobacteriaceae bacterium]